MIASKFNIKVSNAFGKYLGFPILHKHPKPTNYQFIIDNMQSRLTTWKANFLNIAGRTTLAISTLNSIPSYAMQYTHLPIKILKQIDRILCKFIRGSTNETKKVHYMSWKNITKTKEEGGVGLKTPNTKNMTTLSNLAWRLLTNPTATWSRLLIFKYANNKSKGNTSSIWKSILKGWTICSKVITWQPSKNSNLNKVIKMDVGPSATKTLYRRPPR